MFRSEEDARKAAEMVGSDEAVAERKSAEAKRQDEQLHEAAVAQAEQDKVEKRRKEEEQKAVDAAVDKRKQAAAERGGRGKESEQTEHAAERGEKGGSRKPKGGGRPDSQTYKVDNQGNPIDNEEETPLSEQIATASADVNTEPTEGQKEAGNYKKGHVQVGTFDITIEQPKGSVRKGTDANGKQLESKMHNTYGYFRGTEGVDGDHIDVFLSNDIDGWNGRKVYVVDQYNPDGTFDEHKVMLGFNNTDEAKSDYLANYEKGWENGRRIDVSAVNLEDFEKWIGSSHRKTKPFAEYAGVKKETIGNAPAKEDVTPTKAGERKEEPAVSEEEQELRKEYYEAEDHLEDVMTEWDEKIMDYVAEHYPTQATVSAETRSPKGIKEREAMKKDPVLKRMRRERDAAVKEASNAATEAWKRMEAAERARETGEPDEAEGEPKPVGKGLFGNIYDQFKGKVKEAVEFLMKHKSGDLLGVFHRSDVGDIDLVWGDDDKGLQHIINGHILVKDPDFKNINEAIFLIDDIVKNGKVVKEGEAKIVFGKDGYRVVICKNINGKQKNWVLTSYDSTNGKGKKRKDCLIVPPLLPLILMKEAGLSLPQTIFLPAKIVQARQMRKRGREKAKKEGTHRQAKL